VGHPGWSTLVEMSPYLCDDEVIGAILRGTPMPLLERIHGIGPRALGAIGDAELPIRELSASALGAARLPKLTGLRALERLSWSRDERDDLRRATTPLAEAPGDIASLGLLDRVRELGLGGYQVGSLVTAPLALFATLPPNIEVLRVSGYDLNHAEVRKGGHLRLSLTAHEVEDAATDLGALAKERIASLTVVFDKRGYFTKKTRPAHADRIRAATRHLPSVTVEANG
jgi:hypothetical protein